jgi:hypothetical protein
LHGESRGCELVLGSPLVSYLLNIAPLEDSPLTRSVDSTGVPQVVLPVWMDCYDFGNRVELLKIGVYANKRAMPRWEQNELYEGLFRVLLSDEAEGFCGRAKALAKRYPENSGREKATDSILGMLSDGE